MVIYVLPCGHVSLTTTLPSALLLCRYELDGPIGSQMFLTMNNMKAETFDIMKYKFLKKVLGPPAVDASSDNLEKAFVMIFGGSSVTAGHDSFFNQSYPMIVQARLGPILANLGVDLRVHNIAQGANNCSPYQLCYEAMGGRDPDWVGWEQSYNCGHDDGIFELAARVAGQSKNKAVIYYSASGAWSPSACAESTDPKPYSDEDWTPASAGIAAWTPGGDEIAKEKKLLDDYAKSSLSANRFQKYNADNSYAGVSPHGLNVWESNRLCKGRDKADTKDITNCNGIDAAQKCKLHFMTKEASVYGKEDGHGANWHPTRAFHMLRGEAITWLYTLALLEGLNDLQAKLESKKQNLQSIDEATRVALFTDYSNILNKLQPDIPEIPKRCQTYHCEAKATCYTDYLPHFPSDMSLKDVIVGKTRWSYEPEIYGEWSLQYGYLDSKPLWQAKGDKGDLHLKIEIHNKKTVWICGALSESLLKTTIYLDANVPVNKLKNYDPMDSGKRVEWKKKKYIGNECKAITDLPVGTHVLSISTANAKDTDHTTGFSHLITWE